MTSAGSRRTGATGSASVAASRPRASSTTSPCARRCWSRWRRASRTRVRVVDVRAPAVAVGRAEEARARPTRSCATSGSTASPTSSSRTSRPARAGSPSSRASSRSARACCCSTSRPPGSRNARPRRSRPLIRQIRDELDAAVLLIEHDMPLVMQVSDRVYCLEAGNVIAEGSPDAGAPRPTRRRELPRHRRA